MFVAALYNTTMLKVQHSKLVTLREQLFISLYKRYKVYGTCIIVTILILSPQSGDRPCTNPNQAKVELERPTMRKTDNRMRLGWGRLPDSSRWVPIRPTTCNPE